MKVYVASCSLDDAEQRLSVHSTRQGAKNACHEMEVRDAKQIAKFSEDPFVAILPERIQLVWEDQDGWSAVIRGKSVLTAVNVMYYVQEYEVLP